jgi:hypothetical protein
MIFSAVPFEELSEQHMCSLIESAVPERRSVEYKRELPRGGDEAKREFLADASSFANAGGGDLLYGIEEQDGIPTSITPLQLNPDQDALRWEAAIRDGISPRVPGVRVRAIPVAGGHVLLLRIPYSWVGPHAVTFKGVFRFYSRTSAGKYLLDVGELRSAYLGGIAIGDQIRAFRSERLAIIEASDAPVLLASGPKIVVQLVSYEALSGRPQVDLMLQAGSGLFQPLFTFGGTERWNIDGLLTYVERPWDAHADFAASGDQSPRVVSYSQLFRNGIFEGTDAYTLAPPGDAQPDPPYLYAYWFEKAINTGLANPIEVMRRIGVECPIAILVTVLGARGYQVLSGDKLADSRSSDRKIDRDLLVLPDIVLETYPTEYRTELPRLLRSIVDAFWQAGGWPRSNGYSANGDWIEGR